MTDKYTHEELTAAFEAVQDPADWKAPICVALAPTVNIALVVAAIEFYTATTPRVSLRLCTATTPTRIIVESEGYRAGPAGDH